MLKIVSLVLAAGILSGAALAQDKPRVDLRGLDTLGTYSGKAIVTLSEPKYSGGPQLDLSNPELADTLSGGAQIGKGLCNAPTSGSTVTDCYTLQGGTKLPGDTLK